MTAHRSSRPPAGLFTSRRERRLWGWTFAVVVAIYSTLGLARTLASELRARDLLDTVFVICALAILASTAALALRIRPGGAEIGVALGVIAVYVLVLLRMALPEERTHLMEYGVVAILVQEALRERSARGRRVPVPALIAIAATGVIGAIDESIQAVLPSRVFDPVDMLVNLIAAVIAVGANVALARARRMRPSA